MKDNTFKKNVLITGGSSGIGFALARKYASLGYILYLVARNLEKLNYSARRINSDFPDCEIHIFIANVANLDDIKEVYTKISSLTSQIDLLICNAGVMLCGRFESKTPEESHNAFETNYWGMHNIVFYFLPLLKKASKGKVLFISSVAGYTGLFGYSHYAPANFAIAGLAESLRMELKDYGMVVSVAYPPDTETPMLDFERENSLPESRALSKGAKSLEVQKVAEKIAKCAAKDQFEIYFNAESKFIRILKGIAPSIYYKIVDRIVKSSRKK